MPLAPAAQAMYTTWWAFTSGIASERDTDGAYVYNIAQAQAIAAQVFPDFEGTVAPYNPIGLSQLFAAARRIGNTETAIAAADPESPITDAMVAQAPWARPPEQQAAAPEWWARGQMTYTTPEGDEQTGTFMIKISQTLPYSVQALNTYVGIMAQSQLADTSPSGTPRQGQLQSIDSLQLLAVLPVPDGTAHYLRPNGKTSTPPAVIFADTETRYHLDGGLEVHELRCWEAQAVWRRDRRRAGERRTLTGTDQASFAAAIDGWASYAESTWLYTHNVSFDLTVTDLASWLGDLGWVLSSRFSIGGDSLWCVFRKGARTQSVTDRRRGGQPARERARWNHTLTIADSASLFPGKLADLAPHVGLVKPEIDFRTATDAEVADRCHWDTEILAASVLALMDWWDEGQYGKWTVTGAGQAWATYKATLDPKTVVIDHDPAIIEWERAAVYGGRRDVFRIGGLPAGRYGEIDFTAAHCTIAAHLPLPARAACKVGDQHRQAALRGRVPIGMIAEVTIATPKPGWPCRIDGRVFYPVGRFRTILAAPDIQAAADAGVLEAVHDGWLFTMTRHLSAWAKWCLALLRDTTGKVHGAVRVWARLASRAVIGKFAQRGWRTEPSVGPPDRGWSVQPVYDMWTGTKGVYTGANGDWYMSWADQRGEHERPAVLAFVEAYLRSRLAKVIDSPYGGAVCQCDTDGVMVSHTLLEQLAAGLGTKWHHGRIVPRGTDDVIAAWNDLAFPLVMREKNTMGRVVLYGPQHVILDGKLRAAGVPKSAWKTGEHAWAARLWPGLAWQSANAPPGTYARPVQPYKVFGPYAQAWVLDDGEVKAAEVAIGDEGENILLPWNETRWATAGHVLGPVQAQWAENLWTPQTTE